MARRPDGRVPPHFTKSGASSACMRRTASRSGCVLVPAADAQPAVAPRGNTLLFDITASALRPDLDRQVTTT